MNYIARVLEERLRLYQETYKAILVTGARQVGESTLLKRVFPDRNYVSLDDPFPEQQTREASESLQKTENIWELIHRGGYPEMQDKHKEWSAFYADANEGLGYRHFVFYYRGRDKKKVKANAIMTLAFGGLDQISGKKRGIGAVVCNCPEVGRFGRMFCRYRFGIYDRID